ncbi:MAG: MaoC family dehydratase [Euzebyaceae bacterium]|jgi:acyl dehydratase|nr:MaoC family dehydratase [Euzebyaceae bacterium]
MRFLEDLQEGEVIALGVTTVAEEEIIEFGRRYDPQPFHVDPELARESIYGGLIASGWHTCALFMGLLAPGFLNSTASLGSPGVDEVRWSRPVRPGDTLTGTLTILATRPSRSRPDRGIVTSRGALHNQDGDPVLTLAAVNMIGRRPD